MSNDRTAQDTLVNDQIELLHNMELAKMDPETYLQWQRHTDDMKDRYQEARKKEDDKAQSKADREYAGKVGENIAKALPVISKGIISAKKAFEKGDYVTGSAAIMDICAAAAPIISSLLAAAGPEGMLVGALFSVIGQILGLFGPKEESQISQMETLLKDLANERELEKIKAVHDEVLSYASTLITQAHDLSPLLAKPLKNHEDYKGFFVALKETTIVLKDFNPHNSVAMFNNWTVIEYLKNEVNQDVSKWPEVLGVCCQTYSDLVSATMTITLLANNNDMRRRLHDVDPSNTESTLSTDDKRALETALLTIQAYADVRKKEYSSCNATMLRALKEITPAARDRGLYVALGTDQSLHAATGRKGINIDWKNLSLGYGGRAHRFSITVPKEDVGSLTPKYHIFLTEYWIQSDNGAATHGRIDPASMGISGAGMISGEKFSDVWALPAPKDQKPRDEEASFVYAAHDGGTSGYVKLFELDAKNQLTEGGWSPGTKSGVSNVRAVTHPPETLPDDPDKDAMPPGSLLLGGVDHYNSIIYGALRSSSEIYVDQSNTRCYVPSPWGTYSGIDVDPYYLWVFRPEGFACATHASVISCIQGKRKTPRWMEHSPNELLGDQSTQGTGNYWLVDGQETKPRPALKGLISLSPCKDGTLFASIYTRTVSSERGGDHWLFEAKDSLGLHTAVYSIDLKAGRINIEPWMKCGGLAVQVQKMPIPCWSLFESLKADLQAKLNME